MYVYDVEIKTESVSATGNAVSNVIRIAQFCPSTVDVSMWCKRVIQMLFDATGNKLVLPGTNEVLDIENLQGIRVAFST